MKPTLKIHERIEVIYEDTDVVVIEKASGVLSYPVEDRREVSAIQLIRKYWESRKLPNRNLYLLHRLDQDTSGLMMYAKTTLARETLQRQFEEHTVVRGYLALTGGVPARTKGVIKNLLGRDTNGKRSVSPRGKLAITRYEVVRSSEQSHRALILCMLKTGRTHQVRIHLAYIGAPVLGDAVYGVKMNSRLALHSCSLGFTHPRSGSPIVFYSPLPPDLKEIGR